MQGVHVVNHPLVQHKLTLMRDKTTPSQTFRTLLKEISLFLGYEIFKDLPMTYRTIDTPLMPYEAPVLAGKKLALISVLRAGGGLVDGLVELVPSARIGHIGMYRDEETFRPVEYLCKLPSSMDQRLAIIADPMLATGYSAVAAVERVKQAGAKEIRFVCLLAAPEGIEVMQKAHPDVPIFTASIDEKLNEKAYIVPGLGDAGDRIYGTK